ADAVKEQALQVLYRVEKREQAPQQDSALDADAAAKTAKSAPGVTARRAAGPTTATGGGAVQAQMGALTYSGPSKDGSGKAAVSKGGAKGKAASGAATKASADGGTFPGTPKNAQCPCGSGKKYKLCHGKNEA